VGKRNTFKFSIEAFLISARERGGRGRLSEVLLSISNLAEY
jgi:hypothetical protein